MENASKALLMAAGILIGLILLTSGVYLFNTIRSSQQAKYANLSEEQILAYNAEFESYDKQRMYGTDVITVLNKARDNNKRYEDDDSNHIYIAFKLIDNVNVVIRTYTWNGRKFEATTNKTISRGNNKYQYNFVAGQTYSLRNSGQAEMIKNFLNTSTDKTEIKDESGIKNINSPQKGEYYTITYTGFSDFKRMIFKCNSEKIEYNKVGKICYMEFEQIKPSTY